MTKTVEHPADPAPASASQRAQLAGLRRHGGIALATAIALPLAAGLVLVGQAFLLSRILGDAISGGRPLDDLAPDIAAFAALLLLRIALVFLGECAAARASERIKRRLRNALTARLIEKQPDWVHARPSGALAGAIVDQVEALDGFFSRFLPATIQAGLLPLLFAAAVLPFDGVVCLLFLLTVPMIPLFMALVGWGAQAASDAQADALSRLSGLFADRLRGLQTLMLFGRMEAEAEAMRSATDELRRRTLRVLRIAFLSSAVLEFFAALGVAGVALYVGLTFLDMVDVRFTSLSLQAGLFCLIMAPDVYQPLRQLATHYHDRAHARAALAEITRQFEEIPPDVMPVAATGAPASFTGRPGPLGITVRGLSLQTPDGQTPDGQTPNRRTTLLLPTDLVIPAGRHVALLGTSGIGKSTLLNALARLRPFEGSLHFGEDRLEDIPEADLRRKLAIVGQRPRLFHGTIADNIRLGCRNADDAAVRHAADIACVTAFSDRLPAGLQTPVGENGLGLSGGEAQRVALARLYLTDPSIILLDEPTAHLDPDMQARVLDGILAFAAGRTLVVATHAAAVADRMDMVLTIRDARLTTAACRPALLVRDHAA
ncbi:thiol reductant ABC exporter subunit CydD [Rhizobium sp. 9140]|uniref:thiol reductant ABC exporter subunit CydD n=1 Tax=Rhizobium sp. 9140 TaxID=1761900 RepID=UPI000793C674|nr:thiol reductant ABC exporter subunit CydD [Rhizobium sp. 9140]CZT36960.1 ATP-binding cassette, subfamily C, CydD [Rhizobium sp. 9140]